MSVSRQIDQGSTITAQVVTSTTETVVATGPRLATVKDVYTIALRWYLELTIGTGQTTLTVRIRRSSLTGAVVGNPQALTVTAGNAVALAGLAIDTGSFTDYATHVLTVQQAGGAGNATVNEAVILAETF